MVSITQVQAFVTIVETGSFQDAAQRLGCSQPTVSQALKNLEEILQVTLIQRSRGRSMPTTQGLAFLPHAKALLKAAERIMSMAGQQKSIVVGASGNIGTYILPKLLHSYLNKRPELSIDVQVKTNSEVADALENGEVDIALMEWWDKRPGYDAHTWAQESMVVITPPSHPWAERRSIKIQDLLKTPLIGGEKGTGTATLLKQAFGDEGATLAVSYQLGSTEAVKSAVKAGLGISIVLDCAVRDDVKAGTLCAIPLATKPLKKHLMAIMPTDLPKTAPTSQFMEWLTGLNLSHA